MPSFFFFFFTPIVILGFQIPCNGHPFAYFSTCADKMFAYLMSTTCNDGVYCNFIAFSSYIVLNLFVSCNQISVGPQVGLIPLGWADGSKMNSHEVVCFRKQKHEQHLQAIQAACISSGFLRRKLWWRSLYQPKFTISHPASTMLFPSFCSHPISNQQTETSHHSFS